MWPGKGAFPGYTSVKNQNGNKMTDSVGRCLSFLFSRSFRDQRKRFIAVQIIESVLDRRSVPCDLAAFRKPDRRAVYVMDVAVCKFDHVRLEEGRASV